MTPETDAQEALTREVEQRMKLELGNLLHGLIVLQAQNASLRREVERLSDVCPDAHVQARRTGPEAGVTAA